MSTRPRPEDFLELVQRAKRGRLKLYIGFAAGVGKTYQMLEEAHALRQARCRRDPGVHRAPWPPRDRGIDRGARGRPRAAHRVPGRGRRGDGSRGRAGAQARGRHSRRDRAYQRAGQPQPQALPGRDRAHRCRHQRDRRLQHPAPGVAQRPGRARHRRCGARDRPRQLPQASRPDRQSRPRGRRSAGAPEGGQDLCGGQDLVGARALLPAAQPVDAARARLARGRREPGARERGPGTA